MTTAPKLPRPQDKGPTTTPQTTRPAIERRAINRPSAPRGADVMNQQSSIDGDD